MGAGDGARLEDIVQEVKQSIYNFAGQNKSSVTDFCQKDEMQCARQGVTSLHEWNSHINPALVIENAGITLLPLAFSFDQRLDVRTRFSNSINSAAVAASPQ